MSKIDGVIADVGAAIEKLNDVQNRLRELKIETESVEKARDQLRRSKTPKKGASH